MKTWSTLIYAKSPLNGELLEYFGPNIEANTYEEAQEYCEQNGLGYCWIRGQLRAEIPETDLKPDWVNRKDYDYD